MNHFKDGQFGAGPSLAPRLLVAFGEQRERFTSAAEMQKYSGVAPVTERSGRSESSRLQVDPYPVSMLADANSLR